MLRRATGSSVISTKVREKRREERERCIFIATMTRLTCSDFLNGLRRIHSVPDEGHIHIVISEKEKFSSESCLTDRLRHLFSHDPSTHSIPVLTLGCHTRKSKRHSPCSYRHTLLDSMHFSSLMYLNVFYP